MNDIRFTLPAAEIQLPDLRLHQLHSKHVNEDRAMESFVWWPIGCQNDEYVSCEAQAQEDRASKVLGR